MCSECTARVTDTLHHLYSCESIILYMIFIEFVTGYTV